MPVTAQEIREYEKQVRRIQQDILKIKPATNRRIRQIVNESRLAINDILQLSTQGAKRVPMPPSSSRAVSQAIELEVIAMNNRVELAILEGQNEMWKESALMTNQVATTLNLQAYYFSPPTELLAAANAHSAELVRSIPAQFMPKVDEIIRQTVTGGLTPNFAMQRINELVGIKRGYLYTAERIVRTESMRIYSIAFNAQIEAMAGQIANPELLEKTWVTGAHRPGRREDHRAIDGQTVPVKSKFVITRLSGKKAGTKVYLRYPRDPNGPPDQVIQCGCTFKLADESLKNAALAQLI